ncbi:hypothetical protein GF378_00105 [Candidatus Pacearchaeota archaeon]|nr:hypothetical protein [Candidatus Pacearchaeota archaeon]
MFKDKRGWIRIIEAFIAVLLVAGALLIVINQGYIGKADISEQVYEVQLAILREIELNDNMRSNLLEINEGDLPVKWDEFDSQGLTNVKNKINERVPDYLNCTAKVCLLDVICYSEGAPVDRDVYAQSVAIAANLETYSPRQLKMFCWTFG